MMLRTIIRLALILGPSLLSLHAEDLDLAKDRNAIERVYHEHRTGTKPPFEQAMPPALIERMVAAESHKAAVLHQVYGTEVTPAMVAAEVQRINSTTRAPEMLAELKHALGDDEARFARSIARPIVVERELRRRFENDDKLHAEQRRVAEKVRDDLMSKKTVEHLHEVTWQLMRHADGGTTKGVDAVANGEAKSASYTTTATAQFGAANTTPAPANSQGAKSYFDELAPDLQRVLTAQLRQPGDVSAVIETPAAFLVYRVKARTSEILSADSLSIPKIGYEDWLKNQRTVTK